MVNVIFSLLFMIATIPGALRRALATRAIAWANFRDADGSAGGWIPMRWVINTQKFFTPFFIWGLMENFYPSGYTAELYFISHWFVAWGWLLKDAAAPDKGFDRMRLSIKGAFGVWIGALGPYWVPPVLIMWRHMEVPLWWAIVCTGVAVCGTFLTTWSDVHKAYECEEAAARHQRNFLVDTGPWAWSRHPGYFGELLSYGALAAMPAPWFFATGDWWALLPLALLSQVWAIVMIPNLCRLETHMAQTRGDAWREYAGRVPVLIPWPRVSWRILLAALPLPLAMLAWSAWQ